SPEEMAGRFARWPEAVTNTKRIADRCNAKIPMGLGLIPNYPVPEIYTQKTYLREKVDIGLKKRYGTPLPEEVIQRAEYELGVIEEMKFVDYFLVVWDLVRFAREADIPVGPGRGSGAGCLIAYALGITNLDPIHYKLLFERFLNPERVSMPDFDIDFCIRKREKLIEYSRQKYGEECVSQIGTFGRMLAKNVIRNVARTLGMPIYEASRIANLIPNELKITLKKAAAKEPELKRAIEEEEHIGRLWKLALRLEGTINSFGTHAAGVVLCDHPLTDHIGLFKAANSDVVTTQTEMKGVEQIGLLKMDILGLRTLTMISDAVIMIKKNRNIDIDIDTIPLDDQKTYELLRSGQTFGVFQLESSGMRELAKRIGLKNIEEVSALVALYRPGPMAYLETYISNKREPDKVEYIPASIKPLLEETYGICLYQEQVMQLVQLCGGFSLGRADLVRRAMGKKNKELLSEQKIDFVKGCIERDISTEQADDLWSRIETFAGYGFNKSHSMAYAFIAYQTAYLKANYTVEFLCALLSSVSGDLKKVALYISECRNLNVTILPPDINHSEADFSVENKSVRFGLSAIKNVGEGPCQAIVEERQENGPYKDVFDFCGRLSGQAINSRTLENLNKAGALLGTGWNRRQVAEVAEQAISTGNILRKERDAGQTSLFDLAEAGDDFEMGMDKPEVPEWPDDEMLAWEKELIGLYVTGHPLNNYTDLIRRYNTLDLATFTEYKEGTEAIVCGMITEAKKHYNRKGTAMAFLTLETMQGPCEMTVFSDLYEQKKDLLQ
ncbi:MAG: DNA polymerase III subunit alpha, partial [Candidatus Hydrogenedentes bacterium]|nr:DNA polymerase III subunit alpha [Candidatus Hydrogenedentota bacterium]